MTWLIWLAGAILTVATAISIWRLTSGPTPLDRIIASDVIVAIMIASVAVYSALTHTSTGLPILLGLSVVGFTGAVGVAKLISSDRSVQKVFDRRRAMREEAGDDR